MSDLAIAAVTRTLRNLLYVEVRQRNDSIDNITTLPPDKANQGDPSRRLNLFLYHVGHNAAWRNQIIPNRAKPGETAYPPLALTLHYLITAYGDDDKPNAPPTETDHGLLGTAMRALHDHPVLTRTDIENAAGELHEKTESLERQFEPVRLTPETLSVDEMSKLWTTFQTQYRVSTSYQASVVLLESKKAVRTPLPVLKRGENDRGAEVTPEFSSLLTGIEYRDLRSQQSALTAARLNDIITIRGERLPAKSTVVVRNPNRRTTPQGPDANVIARLTPLTGSNSEQIIVALDEALGRWVSGQLQATIQWTSTSGKKRTSSPIHLGPNILLSTPAGKRTLTVQCNPPVARLSNDALPEIVLVLTPKGDGVQTDPIQILDRSPEASDSKLDFDVSNVQPGEYRVRLRIETVESIIVKRDGLLLELDDLQVVRL
jgi:hypothetical protein